MTADSLAKDSMGVAHAAWSLGKPKDSATCTHAAVKLLFQASGPAWHSVARLADHAAANWAQLCTYLVAANLVRSVACGVNLVHCVKRVVLKRHLHEIRLDKSANLVQVAACAAIVVKCPTDLVGVVVHTCTDACGQ